jgi:ubiquinone/menaquinone biosynthesis C-methylase UbiE
MEVIEREKEFWEHHADFDWMADSTKQEVVQMLPKLSGDVLEVCVGSGLLTGHLPATYASYVGLDLSRSLLTTLRARMPSIPLVQGDAQDLCFSSGSFDVVLIFAGLHHLPQFERAVLQAYRVLRPNGVFVCLEPSAKAWYRRPMWLVRDFIGIYSEDEVFLNPDRVIGAMREAGFMEIRPVFLTPRFRDSFLGPVNRVLARVLYMAAAMGSGPATQSFFLMSGRKPAQSPS